MRSKSSCRLLFVSTLREDVASHRFRVTKLVPLLKSYGLNVGILRFNSRFEAGAIPRLAMDLLRYKQEPRIVVFQKTIAPSLAKLARWLGGLILMDLDDGSMQRLDGTWYPKYVERDTERWIRLMDAVVVSTKELYNWVEQWNNRIYVIPTCVDAENYISLPRSQHSKCVVGWVGSQLPKNVVAFIEPPLVAVTRRYDCQVLLVGRENPGLAPNIPARFIPWRLDLEPRVFSEFDIGINPLPDNERARMKAGFKSLQYMAAGLPVVASPIGANTSIIHPGWNGFLANTPEEWEIYLARLICDANLRQKMGHQGREFVAKNYQLEVAARMWQDVCVDLVR